MKLPKLVPLLIFPLLLIAECTPLGYQKAQVSPDTHQDGYLDKEVSPGVHIIEVRQEARYALMFHRETTEARFRTHWERRAAELCPNGYTGTPEMISPREARIDEFYCTLEVCQKYPLLSGVAFCKKVYEL